jgi:hypothetical protein
VKSVVINGGKKKKAAIYIDIKVDRYVSIYMLPVDTPPSQHPGSHSASPLSSPLQTISRSGSCESLAESNLCSNGQSRVPIPKGILDLRKSTATPALALVLVLRTIKDL